MRIEFGKPLVEWEEYKLKEVPILYNGEESRFKAVIKDGNLVTILGIGYRLLPNEEAVRIAGEVAGELGAKPVDEAATYNRHATRVYCSYILPDEKYDIVGKDIIFPGFTIQNGIDGYLAFSCSGFTYRQICANGAFIGYKQMARFYRRHTKGLEVDRVAIRGVIHKVLDETRKAIKVYAKLAELELNEELATKLAKLLPKKVLPDYIRVERGQLKAFEARDLWSVYNDVTAAIWHNAKADIDSKAWHFQVLHQIIPVVREL